MRVITAVTTNLKTGKVLSCRWYEYFGDLAWAKGASPAETSIANNQNQFYQQVLSNYNTAFAANQNILNNLTQGWSSTFNAGPNQYGFGAAEDAAMRTQATEGTAAEYNKALTAVDAAIGSTGGGNSPNVTSGANQQMQAETAKAAAAQESNQQLGITQAGYNQGWQKYQAAASALGKTADQYNPTGYGGMANTSGQNAFSMADTVQKENAAASPWNVVSGILGGALGAGLDAFTGGLGGGLASGIMGGGGGGGNPNASSPGFGSSWFGYNDTQIPGTYNPATGGINS